MSVKKTTSLGLAMLTIFSLASCTNNRSANETIKFTLEVENLDGSKVVDCLVNISNSKGEQVKIGSTDENGIYSWEAPSNETYTAELPELKKGYKPMSNLVFTANNRYVYTTITSSIIMESLPSNYIYQPGDLAYDFTFTDYSDSYIKYNLSNILGEKLFICLNFFYVGCGPCEREFPIIQKIYEKYKYDMELIAIDVYKDQSTAMISNYRNKLGLTFPTCKDATNMMAYMFDVHYVPTTVIIDRYGRIDYYSFSSDTSELSWDRKFAKYAADDYVPGDPTWDKKTW